MPRGPASRAVVSSRCSTWAGVIVVECERTRAAIPLTMAAEHDVPAPETKAPGLVLGPMIAPPGAARLTESPQLDDGISAPSSSVAETLRNPATWGAYAAG